MKRLFAKRAHKKGITCLALLMSILSLLALPQMANAGSYDDFFRAIAIDDASAVKRWLRQGFDPNTVSPNGTSALHMAVMEQSFNVAQALVESPNIRADQPNGNDETPLMLAALKGHLALSSALINKGAQINKSGWTPLHYAASSDRPGSTQVVQTLLTNGAHINAISLTGTTPLMLATLYGTEPTILHLLQEGANPLMLNNAGRSALDLASQINRKAIVKSLTLASHRWREHQGDLAEKIKARSTSTANK